MSSVVSLFDLSFEELNGPIKSACILSFRAVCACMYGLGCEAIFGVRRLAAAFTNPFWLNTKRQAKAVPGRSTPKPAAIVHTNEICSNNLSAYVIFSNSSFKYHKTNFK